MLFGLVVEVMGDAAAAAGAPVQALIPIQHEPIFLPLSLSLSLILSTEKIDWREELSG